MLTGRPGARTAVPRLGTESSDTHDRAPLNPRLSGGHPRPSAYLNMKIQLEKNFEEERQILLQQQKICRNRARKYFVESNRRKKAFEEKLREQEEREHQIREQILQQRKQKFEEVTEKFQRAHIPLSQQRRAVFQKPVPPLEEALKQIQESNLKSKVNFSSSHRPAINWRAIDNALPSLLSKNDQKPQKHLLSKINCDKEMKENGKTNLATNKDAFQLKLMETQKLLEDHHLSSLQNFGQSIQQSSSEPKQTKRGTSNIEEVSDSTSEFLMAENLVKSSVPEDEILTIMSSKQLQNPNLALNKTQQLDICAISTEEQKILQSLNRLNERLYNVQETICKNPSIKNTLQIIPFLNIQPRTSLSPDIGSRLQRKY